LETLLKEDELLNVPLLVFANKQDLVHALGPDEIVDSLGLTLISDRQWMIVACSALSKEGLNDGFDWVMSVLQKK
jgi:ADP-ribosylation factor-like protein 3